MSNCPMSIDANVSHQSLRGHCPLTLDNEEVGTLKVLVHHFAHQIDTFSFDFGTSELISSALHLFEKTGQSFCMTLCTTV